MDLSNIINVSVLKHQRKALKMSAKASATILEIDESAIPDAKSGNADKYAIIAH